MFTVPGHLETLLAIGLLAGAVLSWRRPMISALFVALLLGRQFILVQDLPVIWWTVLAWATAALALGNLIYSWRCRWALIPLAVFILELPIHVPDLAPADIPLEEDIRGYLEGNKVMGAVVLIRMGGEDHFAAYGRAERFGAAPDRETYFPIASVTKLFTGTVFGESDDTGLVALATHTSGYPDIPALPSFPFLYFRNPTEFYSIYTEDHLHADLESLDAEPGTWSYSNAGFCLLGLAMEMEGREFGAISHTLPADARLAGAYTQLGIPVPDWEVAACHGAGGMKATAPDLLEFVMTEDIAKRVYFDDGERAMGLGWKVLGDVYFHGGATFGNTAFVAHDTERDIGMVILISGVGQGIEAFGLEVMADLSALDRITR